MTTNLIALVPKFKLERGPTFVLSCDADGLNWLKDRFGGLVEAEPNESFMIGDGAPIGSDDRCRLTVVGAHGADSDRIKRCGHSEFTWRITPTNSAFVAAQLEALLTSNTPGHQYLEIEHGEYPTVVITKYEYPVDNIRAMRDGRAPLRRIP
jgi:hypothetical protein